MEIRHRNVWSRSSLEGCLKETTCTPCGFTPDMTCLIVESLPAASIAWNTTSKAKETMLTPGMPDKSRLYTTIIDGDMPKDGKTKLSDKEVMLIRDWIRGGAKERRRKLRARRS